MRLRASADGLYSRIRSLLFFIPLRKTKRLPMLFCLQKTRIESAQKGSGWMSGNAGPLAEELLAGSTRQASYFWDAGVSNSDKSRGWDSPGTAMLGCKRNGVLARGLA